MDETVVCPGCQAQLLMKAVSAGQTVQCPRCDQTFEPGKRSNTAVMEVAPVPELPDSVDEADEQFEQPRPLVPPEPPRGEWIALLAKVLTGGVTAGCSILIYSFFDAGLRDLIFVDLKDAVTFWVFVTGFLTAALAFVTFLVWSCVAAVNARSLQRTDVLPLLPLPVLLMAFLCPGLNLIVAYINLQGLWRTSNPDDTGEPNTGQKAQASWWIRACALNLISAVAFLWITLELRADIWIKSSLFIANLNVLAASVLLIFIIHRIMQRQQQRYIRLYEDPA